MSAPDADAAIIACFDDTGLDAARSFARYPVVGICEAALVTAGQLAKRIGIVTTLPRSIVPLEELVRRYGFAERATVDRLQCRRAGSRKARLRCAGENSRPRSCARWTRAPMPSCSAVPAWPILPHALSKKFEVPVVDGVAAAVKQAEALAALKLKTSRRGAYASPGAKAYSGILTALCAALRLIASRKPCRAGGACRTASGRGCRPCA